MVLLKQLLESVTIAEDQDAITARTKYVGAIDGTNMAVGFEAGLVYGEGTAYNLKTDLYLTPALSVGASYAETSADSSYRLCLGCERKLLHHSCSCSRC